jgi:Flp pilus assembly protein TadB
MTWIKDNLNWLIPSLIALAAAAFAWSSARSAKASKESSERSAAAAEASAQADTEMAAIARADREAAEDETRRRPWKFTWTAKGRYEAINHGPTLYRLKAVAPNASIDIETGKEEWTFENGEGFTIWVIVGGGQDPTVVFSWAMSDDPDAERIVQRQRFVFE